MKNWVTFQLSERGELTLEEDPNVILSVIKKYIKSEVFFPMHCNKSKSFENRLFLFKGYIFVEYNQEESRYYSKIADSCYFSGPLLVNRRLHLTSNDEIKKLKAKLSKLSKPNIKLGDRVKILDGKYVNLEAVVTELYPKEKEVDLSVKLKCMNILVPRIPTVCLKNIMIGHIEEQVHYIPLMEKILFILKDQLNGLTRKEIINLIEFTDKEIKRVSTCLSRALKQGLLTSRKNKEGRSIFVYAL